MSDAAGPHTASAAELKRRLELERAGRPFLVLRDGEGAQMLLTLPDDRPRLTIGRSPECDLALTWDEQASRVHAELEHVGPGWAIADGGLSRNGSYLNGAQLQDRRRLSDGDTLRVGRTVMIYREPAAGVGGGRGSTTALDHAVLHRADVSPAQRAVLRGLCRPFADGAGWATPATNNQIAAELSLSLDAVKGHLRVLFAKFSLDELPQNEKRLRLAERALHSGVVTLAELQDGWDR